MKGFEEESTPVQFSTATSLSNLTIDEHVEASVHDQTAENGVRDETDGVPEGDELHVASESEDEDILAACINDGMQNSR